MKELLLQYAKYNAWANKRILDVVRKLETSLVDKQIISSFPSIKTTVYHSWSAEAIWLQRLQLAEQPVWMEGTFKGTLEEAIIQWQKTSDELIAFIGKQFDDRAFQHEFLYHNLQKQPCKLPVYIALNHVFNHNTQHRGQLITMLRQAGITKIPATDLSYFYTNK